LSRQVPLAQSYPFGHVPHTPLQPSGPHATPLHCGVQHVPDVVQTWDAGHAQSELHEAQVSPGWHAPLPQTLSSTQVPFWQMLPLPHEPHELPHPLSPHSAWPHTGVQHASSRHTLPVVHAQSRGHDPQVSPRFGSHTWLPHARCGAQTPLPHIAPIAHVPHDPLHPLGPHSLPPQLGWQQPPLTHKDPTMHPQSSGHASQLSPRCGEQIVSPQNSWS
jgi:hypothetical protein